MNKNIILSENIINRIYVFRNQKVMLDKDLAELYAVETKRLNEQVKRNIERFPESFMFQLTKEEWVNLKSQIATTSWGGRRTEPFVFTEHGILMLSSILNSDVAIKMSVQIIETFVELRKLANNYEEIMSKIQQMESQYNSQFSEIYKALQELLSKPKEHARPKIGYKKE